LGSLQFTRTKRTHVKVTAFNEFNFHKPFGLNKPKKQQLMKYFYLIQVRSGFSFSLKAGKEMGVISNLLTEKKNSWKLRRCGWDHAFLEGYSQTSFQ